MNLTTAEYGPSLGSEEVCPLCLGHYPASAERICVSCEAPSCPECAEALPGTRHVLCYACHGPTKH